MIDSKLFIDKNHGLSIRKQCEILEINRSGLYYEPKGEPQQNLEIIEIMDRHILEEPTAGVLTMQSMLQDRGINAGYERVRRLMRLANIKPIYPRRHLTQWKRNDYIHPYLLRNLAITHSNQVWEIDITYIPMAKGFMYLTAIIDVYSRYIVGWGLSNSLDADSSLRVVKEAIRDHGKPMILNSDQGSQFTCKEYIDYLKDQQIQISMDGKGRALDNIYIERFWRTIKYQHIYLNPATSGVGLFTRIKKWIEKYHYRAHQGIDRTKPINRYKMAA
ncbi:IS3 family transposase [Sphingobacterium sp. JB170]|uniref:IS3 family transposase n=1 Tax=Sphingobacterium sp. JB170 TaxID=1434842 RepID=UPI00097E92DD|nr:IS3 family transposase [Sphingobacterium sp. JB170]SJN48172.1 Mobile element protein [Sphingobacterium sp. JB170]